MIHYPFKYRAKRKPVVPAERCGKPKNWNSILSGTSVGIVLRTLDLRVKEGQYTAVSEGEVSRHKEETKHVNIRRGRSVVSFVNYYGFEAFRRELVQA